MHPVKTSLWGKLKKLWNALWKQMELERACMAVIAVFRTLIRVLAFPVQWLDRMIEAARRFLQPEFRRLKEPTRRQVYAEMTASIIDGILENKNSAAGSRNVKQVKWLCICLLEIASGITTAIGMTIVASDITPIIAIIWAIVIQGLAGILSGVRGRLNAIILAVCMTFSIASDYVCYINAAKPYDAYIEKQYTEFKESYDVAWAYAVAEAQAYASVDAEIDAAFDDVANNLVLLSSQYDVKKLTELQTEAKQLEADLAKTSPTVRRQVSSTVNIHPVTGAVIENPVYEYISNPAYEDLIGRRDALTAQIAALEGPAAKADNLQKQYDELNQTFGGDARAYVKQLLKDLQSSDLQPAEQTEKENTLALINQRLLAVREGFNSFSGIQQQDTTGGVPLTQILEKHNRYRRLRDLEMPAFADLERQVQDENVSVFDVFLENAAKVIDSEFVINATDLRELAQEQTEFYHAQFMETVSDSLQSDTILRELVYGAEVDPVNGVPPLKQARDEAEYKDVIALSMEYFVNFLDDPFTVLTRLLYALLADGLVLLIGFSLRRKNTAIYRIHNRRDLTNEEPRLISEAFYNLALRSCSYESEREEIIQTLIHKLERFRDQFEAESFLRDSNLDSSYGMVCKEKDKKDVLQNEYQELLGLLLTLKYIKPISLTQYEFIKSYKLNKATIRPADLKNKVNDLRTVKDDYYYIMTEGFSLYLSEKINDLHQCMEAQQCSKAIKKKITGLEV